MRRPLRVKFQHCPQVEYLLSYRSATLPSALRWIAHGKCAPGPRARAAPERLVLKLKPPQQAKKARPLPRPAWEGGGAGQACVCWR
jgi:hypothetical protein